MICIDNMLSLCRINFFFFFPPPLPSLSLPFCHLHCVFYSIAYIFNYTYLGSLYYQGCFNPLWVAFAILIGGLLLDVLVSVSLGVSALPANIIIGNICILLQAYIDFVHRFICLFIFKVYVSPT